MLDKIYDSFELKFSKKESKVLRDSIQDGKALVVKVKATHGGYINGNKFYYDIESVQDATKTWLEPFKKPVLIHHDELSDPIGRVTDAEFVPMNTNRKDRPKGHILLTLKITNQDSIEKILDGRYMTVSVGSSPSSAHCSICGRDLVVNKPCDHKRGVSYNDSICFWKIKVKNYNEMSFVNKPADEYQRGIESTEFTDIEEDDLNFESDINKIDFYLEDKEQINEKKETVMDTKNKVDNEDLKLDQVDGTWTQDDLNMVKWLLDEMEKDSDLTDKKLTTETRKKLSSNVFCGPNRAFPVNDCTHYRVALAYLDRYKGPGDKNRIRACIERRGKSLGCPSAKEKTKDGEQMEKEKTNDTQNSIDIENIKVELEALKVKYQDLQKDYNTIKSDKENLELQMTEKTKEIEKINDQLIKSKALNHEILVNKIYDLRIKLGKNDVKDLKDEQIKTYRENLAKRTDESLNDSIIDLEIELTEKNKIKEPTEKVVKDSEDKKEKHVIINKENAKTEIKDLGDYIKNKKRS